MKASVQPKGSDKPIRADAADGLPEEVRLELSNGNVVRAAHLASEKGVPREKTLELRSNAIRQFIEHWHNFEGAKKLVLEYGLSDEEVQTILQTILENPRSQTESMTWFNPKKGRMVATTLAQRIQKDSTFGKYG